MRRSAPKRRELLMAESATGDLQVGIIVGSIREGRSKAVPAGGLSTSQRAETTRNTC